MIPGARLDGPISPSSIMNFVEKDLWDLCVYTQDNLQKNKNNLHFLLRQDLFLFQKCVNYRCTTVT